MLNEDAYRTIHGYMMRITDPTASAFPSSLDAAKQELRDFAQAEGDPEIVELLNIALEKGMQNPPHSPSEIAAANRFFDEMAEISYTFTQSLRGQLLVPKIVRGVKLAAAGAGVTAAALGTLLWGGFYTGVIPPYKELSEDEANA